MGSSLKRVTVLAFAGALPCLCAVGEALAAPEIRWNPVAASGNVVCTPGTGGCGETEIMLLEGGVTVTLFLQVSGWDPDQDGDPSLGAYMGTLDVETLTGGHVSGIDTLPGLDLVPLGATTGRCSDGAFMALEVCAADIFDPEHSFDPLSRCSDWRDCPASHPFCVDRPDFMFYQWEITDEPVWSGCYYWSYASVDCAIDPDGGVTKFYGGTLLLDVPVDATGTYNVNFVDDSNFTLLNNCFGPLIPDLVLTPGQITIQADRCCFGIGTPEAGCLDRVTRAECDAMPQPRLLEQGKVCAEGCGPCGIVASIPPRYGSLWRSKRNAMHLTFGCDLHSTPSNGEVEIVELLDNGAFGPDLSSSFTFEIESDDQGDPRILRIQDTGATLQHRKWYAVRNVINWIGISEFEAHYVVQVGDADGNKLVTSLDVGAINAGIPCFVNCGHDNRLDVDGDGRVISLDVGVVNGHIGSFAVPKPSGH